MAQSNSIAALAPAGDPDFWRFHAEWRHRETVVNSTPAGTDDEIDAEVEWSAAALFPMMGFDVRTVAALEAKMKAIEQMDLGSAQRDLPDGRSFWRAIMDDLARLAQIETGARLR